MHQQKRIKIQLQLEVEVDAFTCVVCGREGHGEPHELELVTEEDARRRAAEVLEGAHSPYVPRVKSPGWHNNDSQLPKGWVLVSWEMAGVRGFRRENRIERAFCPDCRTKAEAAIPPAAADND